MKLPQYKIIARKNGRPTVATITQCFSLYDVTEIAKQVRNDPELSGIMVVSEHQDFCEIWDGGDMLPHLTAP